MAWSKSVFSSMVSEVAWSDEDGKGQLLVTFARGGSGIYDDVPEDEAIALSKAASVGQYLNANIKPFYSYRKA